MAKKKCNSCANAGVYGFDNAPYTEIASAVVGGVVAGQLDKMISTETDGTAKDNYLANNPTIKNAAFLAAGVALTALMPGEMYKGAGIGLATYGGYALITDLMTPEPVISGLKFVPPQNIASMYGVNGLRTLPGNYGVAPGLIAGHGYEGSNYAKEQVINSAKNYNTAQSSPLGSKISVGNLVRAL